MKSGDNYHDTHRYRAARTGRSLIAAITTPTTTRPASAGLVFHGTGLFPDPRINYLLALQLKRQELRLRAPLADPH